MLNPALVIQKYASREAWLAARLAPDTAGASDAAVMLGVSPYATPWAFWESKRRTADEKRVDVLTRGHRWESAVLAEYEDESGCQLVSVEQACGAPIVTIAHPDTPWLRQTPDSFAIDPRLGLGQPEAKTAMHAHMWSPERGIVIDRWEDRFAELVPAHYAVQGYIQLHSSMLPWVDLCALVLGGGWLQVRWVRLLRDLETQAALVAALTEWRERHLLGGEPPPVDGSDACNHYLARTTPLLEFKPKRVATDDERTMMERLALVRARSKADEAEGELLRNRLVVAANGCRLLVGHPAGPYGQAQATGGRGVSFNLYRFKQQEI
jgi:predicted phage-related endonuclease